MCCSLLSPGWKCVWCHLLGLGEGSSMVLTCLQHCVCCHLYKNWACSGSEKHLPHLHDSSMFLIWLLQFWTFLNFNAFEGVIHGGQVGVYYTVTKPYCISFFPNCFDFGNWWKLFWLPGINLNYAEWGWVIDLMLHTLIFFPTFKPY